MAQPPYPPPPPGAAPLPPLPPAVYPPVGPSPAYVAAPPPPPMQAPPRRWGRWVALGCGGLIALVAVLFMIVMAASAGPEKVVQEFLAAAGRGDYGVAYDTFSGPLKESQSYDDFAGAAEANSNLFQVVETTFSNRSVDLQSAKFSGTLTLQGGGEVPASFELTKEDGDWKLIAYHIGQ